MHVNATHIIYTIGHSTHPLEAFLQLLHTYKIQILVDIRSLPGSKKFPQYNIENLQTSLPNAGIEYMHLKDLGGLRKVSKNSKNTSWHNASFRGYADYMETQEFIAAIQNLEKIASKKTTVIMCAEVLWWRCHRSMISDYLKTKGWTVMHILSDTKTEAHHFTAPAKIINGILTYHEQ